jgi:hypothetical protein
MSDETDTIDDVYAAIQEVGTVATFKTNPSISVDTDTSRITLGTSTEYTPKVSPPLKRMMQFEDEGRAITREVMGIFVPAGRAAAGTALGFTPELTTVSHMLVTMAGADRRILSVQTSQLGDSIIGYSLALES